jgi:hypothetical protein
MNTHAERIVHSRLASRAPFSWLTTWVNARWEARRARRFEEETMEFLRLMTPKLRDDIGVDFGKLAESRETLADRTPHVLAALAVSASPSESSRGRENS